MRASLHQVSAFYAGRCSTLRPCFRGRIDRQAADFRSRTGHKELCGQYRGGDQELSALRTAGGGADREASERGHHRARRPWPSGGRVKMEGVDSDRQIDVLEIHAYITPLTYQAYHASDKSI